MIVRDPAVAGMFYKGDARALRAEVAQLFAEAADALDGKGEPAPVLPARIVGGIVPHAGYAFSGEVAARTVEAVARSRKEPPDVFVLFGAMHRPRGVEGVLFDRGVWSTPLGEVEVDARLAERVLGNTNIVLADTRPHEPEHSIEVQLPLLQFRFPGVPILPILVPPSGQAHEVGLAVGRTMEIFGVEAVFLGSTDLTHYGPRYQFTPQGTGAKALAWAKSTNDAGVIAAIEQLAAEKVVAETNARHSACGGGAVAATLAAARKLGATRGVVLEHVTSNEVMLAKFGQSSPEAVGYLSAVLG